MIEVYESIYDTAVSHFSVELISWIQENEKQFRVLCTILSQYQRIAVQLDNIDLFRLELLCSKFGINRLIIPSDYSVEDALKFATKFRAQILLYRDNNLELSFHVTGNFQYYKAYKSISPCVCFLTSGSTGTPKVVTKNEQCLLEEGKILSDYLNINSEHNILINVKLSHNFGYIYGIIISTIIGKIPNILSPMTIKLLNKDMFLNEKNIFITSPRYAAYIAQNTQGDRMIISAGSRLENHKKISELNKVIIYDQYGTTESGVIWINRVDNGSKLSQKLFVDLSIDSDKKAIVVSNFTTIIQGEDSADLKFLNKPVKLEDIIVMNEQGIYEIIGRYSNVLNINGEKYSAEIIESEVEKIPGVESTVVEVDNKGILMCFYVSNSELNTSIFFDYIKTTLPRFAIPKYYIKVEATDILYNNGKKKRGCHEK